MDSVYHSGERSMQIQAGAVDAAATMGRQILPLIAHLYTNFIQKQPFVIIGASDYLGMAWSSILCGKPGFLRVMDEQTLRIDALPDSQDPLGENLGTGSDIGLLLIDFSTCRRLRLNGSVVRDKEGLSVRPHQVYANCPKYIQTRSCELRSDASIYPRQVCQAASLNDVQRKLIERADTFFVASYHPAGGADASHRGGFPGFVQVLDDATLVWPDYSGNGMFNTLGNLIENPNCGLLFIDFEKGRTLQLSGSARIIRDSERAVFFPEAERIIKFDIKRIIETENATSLRWTFIEYSPDNPWFC
jgi:uncharacterized protein